VFAYIIRRLLLMIPTFFGILVITFAVVRLQNHSLVEVAQSGGGLDGGSGGDRKVQPSTQSFEKPVDRFRRLGNDRPALLNLRGFLDKDDVVAWLRSTSPAAKDKASTRNRREKELWLVGPFAVEPLAAILRDDELTDLHGPASQALALCAYTSLEPRDFDDLSAERLALIQNRNALLRRSTIAYRTSNESGFELDDPAAAKKRAALLSVVDDPAARTDFHFSSRQRWTATVTQTGFVTFMDQLFTGNLYSESQKRYVFDIIAERWHVTVWLGLIAAAIGWLGSIPIGIRSARRVGSLEDKVTTNSLFMLWSIPGFFLGALLLHHLSTDALIAGKVVKARFPNAGLSSPDSMWMGTPAYLLDLMWHGFLPMLVLCYASFTALSRYMRANLLEQFHADYARTARAKGCSEDQVVYRHCLRNSLITMITLGGGLLGELFSGALIVELLFSIPGLGLLLLEAAKANDAPLVMGSTVISVSLLLIGILLADICYALVDPRVRSRYA